MKPRQIIIYLLLVIILFVMAPHTIAMEDKKKFFGVGADIEKLEKGIFEVRTKGVKNGEGFVYTPEDIRAVKEATITIQLKGENEVYVKVEETDQRGTFIKDTRSPGLLLTDKWKTYQLDVTLSPTTSQLDVFVLTENKIETEFQFKDLQIKQ
jgi:hypothetical protein